jgi:hypothetical protein
MGELKTLGKIAAKLIGVILAFLTLAPFAVAKPKEKAPCTAYFLVEEIDQSTMGKPVDALTSYQESWYKKHGDTGKYAGLCYLQSLNPPLPPRVYFVTWEEHLVSRDYQYTTTQSQTTNVPVNGEIQDQNGNQVGTYTGTQAEVTTTSTPHSGTVLFYMATGLVSLMNSDGTWTTIGKAESTNWSRFTATDTSLLKNALDRIVAAQGAGH